MPCKVFIDLVMPRHRLFHPVPGIQVNIMPGSMSQQHTTFGC